MRKRDVVAPIAGRLTPEAMLRDIYRLRDVWPYVHISLRKVRKVGEPCDQYFMQITDSRGRDWFVGSSAWAPTASEAISTVHAELVKCWAWKHIVEVHA